jgi:hypothetical protein
MYSTQHKNKGKKKSILYIAEFGQKFICKKTKKVVWYLEDQIGSLTKGSLV